MTTCLFNSTKLPDWEFAFFPSYDASAYPHMFKVFSDVCSRLPSLFIIIPSANEGVRYCRTCSPVFRLLEVACDVRRPRRLV